MNRYLIFGILVIIIVIGGYFVMKDSNEVTYVADITSEIDALETDLMELENTLADGSLTPEEAIEVQAKIAARLDVINAKASTAGNASLTASQKLMLENGLERLKSILSTYQATLATVDETVENAPPAVKAQLNVRGTTSITRKIATTIETLEEHADEVIDDFVPEEDSLSDEILEESEMAGEDDQMDSSEGSAMTDETTESDDTVGEITSPDGSGENTPTADDTTEVTSEGTPGETMEGTDSETDTEESTPTDEEEISTN